MRSQSQPGSGRVHLSCAQSPHAPGQLSCGVSLTQTPALPFAPWLPKGSADTSSQGLSTGGRRLAPFTPWKIPLAFYLHRAIYGPWWLEEVQRAGRQRAKSREEKKRREVCTQAANEPVGGSWVSQAWPALLWTLASPLRWQLCSCFMLVWHWGYHRERCILKKCILFFFFFFFCFLVNKAAV